HMMLSATQAHLPFLLNNHSSGFLHQIQIDQNKADIPVGSNFLSDNMINSKINYPPNSFDNIAIEKEVFPNYLIPVVVGIIHEQMQKYILRFISIQTYLLRVILKRGRVSH
ncbi:hypothetical protein ACJX0J_021510, partial [Zea mays]